MITVGIRNLKNSLSQYINMVKSGEKILITDHDKIVAEIIPFSGSSNGSEMIEKYLNEQILNGSIIKATKKLKIIKQKKKNKYENNEITEIYNETRSDR